MPRSNPVLVYAWTSRLHLVRVVDASPIWTLQVGKRLLGPLSGRLSLGVAVLWAVLLHGAGVLPLGLTLLAFHRRRSAYQRARSGRIRLGGGT